MIIILGFRRLISDRIDIGYYEYSKVKVYEVNLANFIKETGFPREVVATIFWTFKSSDMPF